MQRVDIVEPESGDILAGICLVKDKLVACEGDIGLAQRYLEESFTVPGDKGEIKSIDGIKDPESWLEWAPMRLSTQYQAVTEPYEDDDGFYDANGTFIGDAENPPLPNPGATT